MICGQFRDFQSEDSSGYVRNSDISIPDLDRSWANRATDRPVEASAGGPAESAGVTSVPAGLPDLSPKLPDRFVDDGIGGACQIEAADFRSHRQFHAAVSQSFPEAFGQSP